MRAAPVGACGRRAMMVERGRSGTRISSTGGLHKGGSERGIELAKAGEQIATVAGNFKGRNMIAPMVTVSHMRGAAVESGGNRILTGTDIHGQRVAHYVALAGFKPQWMLQVIAVGTKDILPITIPDQDADCGLFNILLRVNHDADHSGFTGADHRRAGILAHDGYLLDSRRKRTVIMLIGFNEMQPILLIVQTGDEIVVLL